MLEFLKRLAFLLLLALAFCGCQKEDSGASGTSATAGESGREPVLADFEKARIGVIAGSNHEVNAPKKFPRATFVPLQSAADLVIALEKGKIDTFCLERKMVEEIVKDKPSLAMTKETVLFSQYAFAFPKTPEGRALRAEFNAFLEKARANGSYAAVTNVFFGSGTLPWNISLSSLAEGKKKLKCGTCGDFPCYTFYENGQLTGLDIELAKLFCKEFGYGLEIQVMNFSAVIPSLSGGSSDFVASAVAITEERAEAVDFSDPVFSEPCFLCYLDASKSEAAGQAVREPEIADFAKARIGTVIGTLHDVYFNRYFPEAENMRYRNTPDLVMAIRSGHVAVGIGDFSVVGQIVNENADLACVRTPVFMSDIAMAFPKDQKGEALLKEFNEFLIWAEEDGIFAVLTNDFACGRSHDLGIRAEGLEAPRGDLKFVTTGDFPGSSFFENGRLTGRDVELALLFCQKSGYGFKPVIVDFGAIIPALTSGQADFCGCNVTITEERAESVNFSRPVFRDPAVLFYFRNGEANKGEVQPAIGDFAHAKIGVEVGSLQSIYFKEYFPNGTPLQFRNLPDLVTALKGGQVDAVFDDLSALEIATVDMPDLACIEKPVFIGNVAIAFPKSEKGNALLAEFNEFLAWAEKDGILEALANDFSKGVTRDLGIREKNLEARKGVLNFVTNGEAPAISFFENGRLTGRDVELARLFCQKCGYGLNILLMDFGALIPALVSGKADFCGCNVTVTKERAESVNFSRPIAHEPAGLCYSVPHWQKVHGTSLGGGDIERLLASGFSEKRLGVMIGSAQDIYVSKNFPKADIKRFKNLADVAKALECDKIDVMVANSLAGDEAVQGIPDVVRRKKPISTADLGFAFPKNGKGRELRRKFDAFLEECRQSGLLEEMHRGWLGGPGRETETEAIWARQDCVTSLVMAANGNFAPFNYVSNSRLTGLDLEIAGRFCESLGLGLKPVIVELDSLILGLKNGKYDFAGSALLITPERLESVDFSTPYSHQDTSLFYRQESRKADTQASNEPWLQRFTRGFLDSARKTFLEEGRWKILVKGLAVTCFMTVAGLLFGTLLGFLICFFRMESAPAVRILALCYIKFFQGTPIVVILMIFYYVIFGRTGMSSISVAIVAFGMNFAAFFSEILRSGIETVDKGQWEAALALGYSRPMTFLRFVLPQAMMSFLPVYRGEAIGFMKSTSVVGYVAVQDLAKMGDIIRSRTYEAFFPLLVVAVCYFALAYCLFFIVELLTAKVTPDRKARAIKGVSLK